MCIVSLTSTQDELRRANGNLMSKHEETEDRLKSAQQTITELTDKYSNLIEVNNQLVARLKQILDDNTLLTDTNSKFYPSRMPSLVPYKTAS